jgi:serine/threonine protein kinase
MPDPERERVREQGRLQSRVGSLLDEINHDLPPAPLPRQEIHDDVEPDYDTLRPGLRTDAYAERLRLVLGDYLQTRGHDERVDLEALESAMARNDWAWIHALDLPRDLRDALRNRAQEPLSDRDTMRLRALWQLHVRREEGLNLSRVLESGLETLIGEDLRAFDPDTRHRLALGGGRDIVDGLVDHLQDWLPEGAPPHLQDRIVLRGLIESAYAGARMQLAGELVEDLGLTGIEDFQTHARQLCEAVRTEDTVRGGMLSEQLGHLFAGTLRRQPPDSQLRLTLGDSRVVVEGLVRAMTAGAPMALAQLESLRRWVSEAYAQALAHLSDGVVDDEGRQIVLDGKIYTREKELDQGGFGRVDLYKAEDGTRIVLKTPLLNEGRRPEAYLDEARNEVRSHRLAQRQGPDGEGVHPRVIGLRGAFRGPDGLVRIALDYAPGGNLYKLNGKIQTAIDQGVISPEAANRMRILLFRDMLEGMRHVQESHGMMHLDFKSPNVFIGEDGSAKIGDFGTAYQGDTRHLQKRLVINPLWQPPEQAIRAQDNIQVRKAGGHGGFQTTGKTDTWSLGITAYEIFSGGEVPFDVPGNRMAQIEDLLMAFGNDLSNRVRTLGTDREGRPTGLGVTALDRLLNQLLHPDPDQRPGLGQILAGSLFDELKHEVPGGRGLVDDPVLEGHLRDLIKALSTGDMERAHAVSEMIGR